jgi:hypothetical protein
MADVIYNPVDACYGIGEDSRDFIMGSDLDVLSLAPVQDNIEFFYNQATLL